MSTNPLECVFDDGRLIVSIARTITTALVCLTLAASVPPALAQVPIQGAPVPELEVFDDLMHDYMVDNDIGAGILGMMKEGKIVYLRGFGFKDQAHAIPLPENTIMRIASVTKPITAAAVRTLIQAGAIGLNQQVFSLEPGDGGILDYEPWDPDTVSPVLNLITVEHLLQHEGGWDRNQSVGDLTYKEVEIAEEMAFDPYRVPTREETVRWIMSQPLQFVPGTDRVYSNVGYLILGLIVEQVSGTDLYTFWREFILDDSLWFPTSEFEPGRTFAADQDPREPWYDNNGAYGQNVFDPYGNNVPLPYGSWNHEARIGQGGLISTAVPLLHHLDRFFINGSLIGLPLGVAGADEAHDGRLRGTEAMARQRPDGVNYVLLLNKRVPSDASGMYVRELQALIDDVLDNEPITWPTRTVDGFWVEFSHNGNEQGSFDEPFNSVGDLGAVMAYSKVRFKPGSTDWTGVFDRGHLLLSAPLGSAVIGHSLRD